jgi:hypothetical protein
MDYTSSPYPAMAHTASRAIPGVHRPSSSSGGELLVQSRPAEVLHASALPCDWTYIGLLALSIVKGGIFSVRLHHSAAKQRDKDHKCPAWKQAERP